MPRLRSRPLVPITIYVPPQLVTEVDRELFFAKEKSGEAIDRSTLFTAAVEGHIVEAISRVLIARKGIVT